MEAPTGYFHTVDTFWPLVVQQPIGSQGDGALDRQLADDAARLARHATDGSRHIAIFDMTWMETPSPLQRERMGAFLSENLATLRSALVGTAFVVPNMFKRGVVTAVFWVQRYPLPHAVVKDMAGALDWVVDQSADAGLDLPHALLGQGLDALTPLLYQPPAI